MRLNKWRIFDKGGNSLGDRIVSPYDLVFETANTKARGAQAYPVTDPSGIIQEVEVLEPGWNWDPTPSVLLRQLSTLALIPLEPIEASVYTKDVSVFDPLPANTKGIDRVEIDLSTNFGYPSASYSSAIFLNPIGQGLVETEHLILLEESSTGWIRPYDPLNPVFVAKLENGDSEIRLFEANQTEQLIEWTDELVFDLSEQSEDVPIIINIGFRSEEEGIFERRLRFYHRIDGVDILFGEILVNAESIGGDERYKALLSNFGLPDPEEIFKIFKESDINEDLPDWELVNEKSKHIILEHHRIMPFIGTYKGLINAIKWLGYDDIYIREWFKDVKKGEKLSLQVPYKAEDRVKTLLYFSPDERRNLKKLNQLSLVYCITRETGEVDESGTPKTENCYSYNLNEVLVKLFALKTWLERNIIGVNAKIIDITGEGIYFERYRNLIYSTQNRGNEFYYKESLSPTTVENDSELVAGDASILLTIKELNGIRIKDLHYRMKDLIFYLWDPSGAFQTEDPSLLAGLDPSLLYVGPTFAFPFRDLRDIQWRVSLEKDFGVIGEDLVSNPLFVYNNDIRFYRILDEGSFFYDVSSNLNIIIEEGFLRDSFSSNWEDSISYSIFQDASGVFTVESSSGLDIWKFNGPPIFSPDTSSLLQYALEPNYDVPLLTFEEYSFTTPDGSSWTLPERYHLDIINGRIAMDSSKLGFSGEIENIETWILWFYDTSTDEQNISFTITYNSPRLPLFSYDPSIYWDNLISGGDIGLAKTEDNSIYRMDVNHIGKYNVEVFGWDGGNVLYNNLMEETYPVWTKFPLIRTYLDSSCNVFEVETCVNLELPEVDVSTLFGENRYPIFDRTIPLRGLRVENDGSIYIRIPSVSFFASLPEADSFAIFYNLTERCTSVNSGDVEVLPLYQKFFDGDEVNLVLWNREDYFPLEEEIVTITGVSGNVLSMSLPSQFLGKEDFATVYIQNTTLRSVSNPQNIGDASLYMDVSTYQFSENQVVNVIISDTCTGYSWGGAFRVLDSSAVNDPSYGYAHLLEGNIPDFVIGDPRYEIFAKHAFSAFSTMEEEVEGATESGNIFDIYLDDKYFFQYYLDNTFVFVNLLFDHEIAIAQWYDPSSGDLTTGKDFWGFQTPIRIEEGTLVILEGAFPESGYMLDQKNIWTVRKRGGGILFRVFNPWVFYVFNEAGVYDVTLEAYDSFGNLKSKTSEGLIEVYG